MKGGRSEGAAKKVEDVMGFNELGNNYYEEVHDEMVI